MSAWLQKKPAQSLAFCQSLLKLLFIGLAIAFGNFANSSLAQSRLLLPDGTSQSASLRSVTSDGKWLFSADKERLLGSDDLLAWGQLQDPSAGPFVVLSDGSILVGRPQKLTEDQLALRSFLWGEIALPRDNVRAIVWQWPARGSDRDRLLAEIETYAARADRVLLTGGDSLPGRVRGKSAEELSLEIELDGRSDRVPLAVSRLAAILFRPPLLRSSSSSDERIWLGMRGDTLCTKKIAIVNGLVTLTLECGVELQIDAVGYAEELTAIFPETLAAGFLSSLKPVAFVHKPFVGSPGSLESNQWPYGLDRSAAGGRLRTEKGFVRRGVGLHSLSQIAFNLDADYSRLVAELSLDQSAGSDGSVVYRLYVDKGTGKFESVWQSDVIRGGDDVQVLNYDLTGVKRVSLVVSYADEADVMDRANWLGCWLVK